MRNPRLSGNVWLVVVGLLCLPLAGCMGFSTLEEGEDQLITVGDIEDLDEVSCAQFKGVTNITVITTPIPGIGAGGMRGLSKSGVNMMALLGDFGMLPEGASASNTVVVSDESALSDVQSRANRCLKKERQRVGRIMLAGKGKGARLGSMGSKYRPGARYKLSEY